MQYFFDLKVFSRLSKYIFIFLLFSYTSFVIQLKAQNHNPNFDNNDPVYSTESVLNKGNWIKLSITETGIYKINYDDIIRFGFEPSSINPKKIGIFFNGNGMLPEGNADARYDDLFENNIYVSGQEDGVFNPDDYILFYGQSQTKWTYNVFSSRFEHAINPYSDTSFYFVCFNLQINGKRIETKAQSTNQPNDYFNQFLDYQYHETDSINLMLSGRQWYGDEFSINETTKNFDFNFLNLVKERDIYLRIEMVGRSIAEDSYYSVTANDETVVDSVLIAKLSADSQIHGRESNKTAFFSSTTDNLHISIPLLIHDGSSLAWLNYLRLNAWRWLKYENSTLFFRNPESKGANKISTFSVSGGSQNLRVWDITNPLEPKNQQFDYTSDSIKFTVETDTLREYVLFDENMTKNVSTFQTVANQNLHAISNTEMLIISYDKFREQANAIKNLHFDDDGLDCTVIETKEIYNEFGCGTPDVSAIRDFIRMVYLNSDLNLKYVLFVGDASYDYKDRLLDNTNFVPTYQSINSLIETRSFLSDDYFGLMENDEGENMAGTLDLGLGRLPVSTLDDAQTMVNKIQSYIVTNAENAANWRNEITFIADDGNGNLHLDQAETLSKQVDTARFEMNVGKIYTDAYKRVTVTGGYSYPDANKALMDKIEEGSLIINYTGHGGVNGLTDEKLFSIGDIKGLTNGEKMPFFITATCEFSRFDNPEFVSAGEYLLLNPNGGAIAMMTTTRVAFSHSNFALNRKLYDAIFERTDVQMKRLGDIIRIAKSPANENINNFTLLGDPALRINYPSKRVITTSINESTNLSVADTVHALSSVRLEGKIVDFEGVEITHFNGFLDIKMYDKKTTYRTLANDPTSNATNFNYFSLLLYKGRVSVINGKFSAEFKLPKDISFNYGKAKISYYAVDTTTFNDATGTFGNFVVGGTDENVAIDENGPEIEMYLNNASFKSGDALPNDDPTLIAHIADPQGINYLGESIGRDIVLTINQQSADAIILNSFFQPEIDNFGSGDLIFKLNSLPAGSYQLELKAWDLHNNSSVKTIDFEIKNPDNIQLTNVINQPNPFSEQTSFSFNTNQKDGLFDVLIDIFNSKGDWITSINAQTQTYASKSFPISWDGKDHNGKQIAVGGYVYRMHVSDQFGKSSEVSQKFIYISK